MLMRRVYKNLGSTSIIFIIAITLLASPPIFASEKNSLRQGAFPEPIESMYEKGFDACEKSAGELPVELKLFKEQFPRVSQAYIDHVKKQYCAINEIAEAFSKASWKSLCDTTISKMGCFSEVIKKMHEREPLSSIGVMRLDNLYGPVLLTDKGVEKMKRQERLDQFLVSSLQLLCTHAEPSQWGLVDLAAKNAEDATAQSMRDKLRSLLSDDITIALSHEAESAYQCKSIYEWSANKSVEDFWSVSLPCSPTMKTVISDAQRREREYKCSMQGSVYAINEIISTAQGVEYARKNHTLSATGIKLVKNAMSEDMIKQGITPNEVESDERGYHVIDLQGAGTVKAKQVFSEARYFLKESCLIEITASGPFRQKDDMKRVFDSFKVLK